MQRPVGGCVPQADGQPPHQPPGACPPARQPAEAGAPKTQGGDPGSGQSQQAQPPSGPPHKPHPGQAPCGWPPCLGLTLLVCTQASFPLGAHAGPGWWPNGLGCTFSPLGTLEVVQQGIGAGGTPGPDRKARGSLYSPEGRPETTTAVLREGSFQTSGWWHWALASPRRRPPTHKGTGATPAPSDPPLSPGDLRPAGQQLPPPRPDGLGSAVPGGSAQGTGRDSGLRQASSQAQDPRRGRRTPLPSRTLKPRWPRGVGLPLLCPR